MSVRDVAARPRARARGVAYRFPTLVGGLMLALTAIPYLVGSAFARGDRRFMGIVLDVPDTTQYFAWMRAYAHASGVLIANPLTPEPNHAAFFNLLWYVLGHLCEVTRLPPAAVYQAFRWGAGAIFFAALWIACVVLCAPGWERRLAWSFAALGGGFGWIWVALKYLAHRPVPPLDIYIAEPNTVLALIAFPHLLLAASMLIGIFLLFLRGYERDHWPTYTAAGVLGLLLGVTHAYDLLIVYMTLGSFGLVVTLRRRAIPWRSFAGLAIVIGLSSPPALYFTYLTQHDPTWRGVLAQYGNAGIVTPPPAHLLILLGPVFLVALATLISPRRARALWRAPERDQLVAIWFLGAFVLAYLPTSYQIKMLNGWQVPAGILAAQGLSHMIVAPMRTVQLTFRNRRARWPVALIAGITLLTLAVPTNLYLIAWRGAEIHRATTPYTLTTGDADALDWLGAHARDGDVVLASLAVGQYVAAASDARPVLAHWAQTLRYYEKEEGVRRYYADATVDSEREALLRQWNVRYVLIGPEERSLGGFQPGSDARYVPVYTSGRTTIYEVRLQPEGE
jgi:hypothetical protein